MTEIFDELFSDRRKLPVIISAEMAECGLACLAMVACYFGSDVDLNGLRERFPSSNAGINLRGLIQVADSLGLSSRALTVEIAGMGELQTPAILHWDFVHFVVLKKVGRDGRIMVHDPASGEASYDRDEAARHFTGVALELSPAVSFTPLKARVHFGFGDLWTRSRGLAASMTQVLVLSAALQIVTFMVPFQIQLVVDQAVNRFDQNILLILSLGFAALLLTQAGLIALRNWAIVILSNLFAFQVIGNLVRHLLRLPGDYFEKRHVGDILSRIGSTDAIRDAFSQGIVAAVIDGLMALLATVIMLLYSPLLTLFVVSALIANFGISLAFYPAIRSRTEMQLSERGREQTILMESVRAAGAIKLMGREAEREGAWRNAFGRVMNATVSVARYQTLATFFQDAITALQTIIVMGLGARMVIIEHSFTLGMLLAFLSFRQTLTDRATSLVSQGIKFRLLDLHLSRIADIATAQPPFEAPFQDLDTHGAIELRDVSFRYGATDPVILKDVCLTIQPGELVLIVGPSGGGKTTLLKILLGLHDPTHGEVLLDGRSSKSGNLREWREAVGVVMQEDRLFSGSVANNIAFFDPNMDMDKVVEAAMAAKVHDEISRLPMRYSSLIGDMGSTLSGGQKQRILLARALYRKPKLLFLDEGTANLDPDLEHKISDLIASVSITRVVVAHRPTLFPKANRIFHVVGQTVTEIYRENGVLESPTIGREGCGSSTGSRSGEQMVLDHN